MRLVDADELIKGRVENDPVRIAVENSPTAYNTEKVAEILKGLISPFLKDKEKCLLDGVENIVKDGMCGLEEK